MRRRITPWLSVIEDRPVNYEKFLEEAAALEPLGNWEPLRVSVDRILKASERRAICRQARAAADWMEEEVAAHLERENLSPEDCEALKKALEEARGARVVADTLERIEEGRNGSYTDD